MQRLTFGLAPLLVVGLLSTGAAAETESPGRITLATGDSAFVDGEHVELATVPDEQLCGIAGPCWDHEVEVTEAAWRLRVALGITFDSPDHVRENSDPQLDAPPFRLVLTPPEGHGGPTVIDLGPAPSYHRELWWMHPPVGTWSVRVVPLAARDIGFRWRIKLEAQPERPDKTRLLLPDLRSVPPFELGFMVPTASYQPGVRGPSPVVGCMAEEIEESLGAGEQPPRACLRLSLGVENAGEGPLLLVSRDCGLFGVCLQTGVVQRAYETDPSPDAEPPYWRLADWERDAGEGRWHRTHVHLHYEGMYGATLFRVVEGQGSKPRLEPAGTGHKLGFDPYEEWMADWGRFSQQDRDCCYGDYDIGLAPGWGDVYEWNRSGNYVDFTAVDPFGAPEPGLYLVRGEVDPEDRIVESDEKNNTSYVLFRVGRSGDDTDVPPCPGTSFSGACVHVLERGYGDDPWDRKKRIVEVTP